MEKLNLNISLAITRTFGLFEHHEFHKLIARTICNFDQTFTIIECPQLPNLAKFLEPKPPRV